MSRAYAQKKHEKIKSEETNFHPRFEDYDVMRNRWNTSAQAYVLHRPPRSDAHYHQQNFFHSLGSTRKGQREDILRFEQLQENEEGYEEDDHFPVQCFARPCQAPGAVRRALRPVVENFNKRIFYSVYKLDNCEGCHV